MSADADLIRDLMADATALRVRLAERAEQRHNLIEEERKRLWGGKGGGGKGGGRDGARDRSPRKPAKSAKAGGFGAAGRDEGRSRSEGRSAQSRGAGFSAASSGHGGGSGRSAGPGGGHTGSGGGSRPGGRPGSGGGGRPGGTPGRGGGGGAAGLVAKGYAPAVVKVVSYATGTARAKATAQYVAREGVEIETREGFVLADSAAVNAEIEAWSGRFGKREPTQDVMGVRVEIAGLRADRAEDRGALMRAVAAGFAGHRHAWQMEEGSDGSLRAHVVTAAAGTGRERFRVTAERIGEAGDGFDRRILDAPSEARIKARMTEAAGIAPHRVTLAPTAPGHGIEGVRHQLDRMVARGPAQDERGRRLTSTADAQEIGRDWRRDLRSQQARDTMHLVMSARAGTDPKALRETVRTFLADRFGDHAYLFGVHTDKEASGHIHAHAVIAVRDDGGRKMQPGPQDFRGWRESYAAHAQAQGLRIVATTARERASHQSYGARDKAIVAAADRPRSQRESRDRAYASRPGNQEMIANARQRIATARSNPIRVPRGAVALAETAEAAQRWAAVAAEQPGNAVAAHYAQRTRDAYQLGERASVRQTEIVSAQPERQQGGSSMTVTAARMETDLKRMNAQAEETAAKLAGPARDQYEEATARILQTSAVQLDLQRLMEKGQTHIDLETARAMLPPDRADAILARLRTQTVEQGRAEPTQDQGDSQGREPANPTAGMERPAGDRSTEQRDERAEAEASRIAARETREAEAAERLERRALEIERADEAMTSQSPEAMRRLEMDRGVSRAATRLAHQERNEADAAEQIARPGGTGSGTTVAGAPPAPPPVDREQERQRVLERVRAERLARERDEQSRDEQEMD